MPSTWIHVFSLCLSLLLQNSTLTIEEFHSKLQEATNFPLRPFVIPFLKVDIQIQLQQTGCLPVRLISQIWKAFSQPRSRCAYLCTWYSSSFYSFFLTLIFFTSNSNLLITCLCLNNNNIFSFFHLVVFITKCVFFYPPILHESLE